MTLRVALRHRTSYRYDEAVLLGPQIVRLRPAPHCRTPVTAYTLRIDPGEHFCNWQQDAAGNWQARLVFDKPTELLAVEVELVAELDPINPFDFFLDEAWTRGHPGYDANLRCELAPYLAAAPQGERFRRLLDGLPPLAGLTIDWLVALNQRLQTDIAYTIRLEPGIQTPDETLAKGSGSCRDTAWLLVQLLRHRGYAARFVSGYLIQLTADMKPLGDGPAGPPTDFTDLHAWAEVYLPGAGWVGFDPTSGLLAGEGHLPLAATADPSLAAPLTGGFAPLRERDEPVACAFDFAMSVERLAETPRVSLPYTAEQVAAIEVAGLAVDSRLRAADARLTMGGEPTFVCADAPDAPEWNGEALGPTKHVLADRLLRRMADHLCSGWVLQHGQGKWYPGEPLPRWAYHCHWRTDGAALWPADLPLARSGRDLGHTPADAERLARAIAERLGIETQFLIPAFEDPWHHAVQERRLPINIDPLDPPPDGDLDRARLARVLRHGLHRSVGTALPLLAVSWGPLGTTWRSGRWFLRDERLYLLPGDSPMGYRLPLDSLPWNPDAGSETDVPADPLAPRGAMPKPGARSGPRVQLQPGSWDTGADGADGPGGRGKLPGTARRSATRTGNFGPWRPGEPAWGVARTALCVEPRDGILRIFLPPVPSLEAWVDMLDAIAGACRDTGLSVQLEGYPPPRDPRLRSFAVTPDPGVIEVNVPPMDDWAGLQHLTRTLYDEARAEHLVAEKYNVDGRRMGSCGGNHITLGAASTADSIWLRRPDALASLIRWWHNHPSLSYLFSSWFIGATSQAPRVDEARVETVDELELALAQVPRRGETAPPWLVDRLFRHLLVDVTGNTHRAELCIDKLYNPDLATGRLGLLEMRGFEMPPHPDMSLAQQLLVRALVARFLEDPYEAPLVRWGSRLQDQWMLPWWLWNDLEEVVFDLQDHGFAIDAAWFIPAREFRCPFIGALNYRGVAIELRHALEPWNVLGEEAGATGTTRFVDASLERIEISAAGLTESRYLVAVNGVVVPLHPTGRPGEFVAGVRFRTHRPASCLQPLIEPQRRLVVDLVDTWNRRAVAGCTYHIEHPGGRNPETRPVNDNEAAGRRRARYQPWGHTPGPLALRTPPLDQSHHMTLDLRRVGLA
jgi:uncharacterized protein (DUF2126 family)